MKYLATAFTVTFLVSSLLLIGCGGDEDGDEDNNGRTSNFPPQIEQIRAYEKTINPGTSTPFRVLADDWDGDSLEYSWQATAGEFDTTTGQSVVWTAPNAPTTAEITVSATDGKDTTTDTVSIEVKEVPDIVSTWGVVSVDGVSLADYKDQITLVHTTEEEEEVEFTVNVGYSSQEYHYKADETYTAVLEFEYRIPKDSGLPLISNIVTCKATINGTYSLTGSELTLGFSDEDFSIDAEYDESKYDDESKLLLDDYIEELEGKMKELRSSVEPGEVSIQDERMEWSNNWIWEKVLVAVKSN